jgi:small subunit ribosomal protein S1
MRKSKIMTSTTQMPSWVSDFDVVTTFDEESNTNEEFESLLEATNSGPKNFKEGEVFKGTVIKVNDDFVTVDIGYKQEGLVFAKEFRSYNGSMKVTAGDEIDVYVEKLESNLGNLVLSKDKAEILQAWDRISEACEKGTPVEGTVLSKVKGGLSVDIGVKAFLPGSQVDLRAVKNLDKFIGKTMEFKVIKFNKKRGNIVLSRRAILSEERNKLRGETLGQIQEGMIVQGIVKNITDYGVFIDLGGVDGLLHITDMSWGRVKHPSNLLSVGDEVNVKILKYDSDKERVSLGLKQVLPNPWESAHEKYVAGQKVSGEVVSIKDYGVFVELDDGIEGLVHVSEMSWTQKAKNPAVEYIAGDRIEAVVLEVDTENKRISLGVKQLLPNPWDKIEATFNNGQIVEGTVKSIVDFGAFIDLGEEVDALIHVSDLSWTKKNVNAADFFKEGEKVKGVVLLVDRENQKFCLGIKQLEEDPWKRIDERIPVGSVVEGQVVRVTEFGAFVELETGIEGMVHISELSEERVEKATDVVNRGDTVKTRVISIDKEAKKIALSIKAVDSANAGEYKEVKVGSATLAEKFKNLNIQTSSEE